MALSREDKADVSRAFGKKAAGAVSAATSDAKNKAIHAKSGGKYKSFSEGGRMGARKGTKTDTRDSFMKQLDHDKGI